MVLIHLPRFLAVLLLAAAIWPSSASESFPFGSELMLDGGPAPKHAHLPMIEIEEDGTASLDLWCGSMRAQAAVGEGTITITPGERNNAQCDPDRVASVDDLLDRIDEVAAQRRSHRVFRCRHFALPVDDELTRFQTPPPARGG
jgi:hypothetical protein